MGGLRQSPQTEEGPPMSSKRNRLHESANELLSSTFNSILRVEERALEGRLTKGLSITEIHTIEAIGYDERNPMNVIAGRLEVTLATLNTAVGKLVEKGYVTRERDETDRRKVMVSLTKSGRAAYRAHRVFHKKMVEEALSGLTPEEERIFLSAIGKVNTFFREQAKDGGVSQSDSLVAKDGGA